MTTILYDDYYIKRKLILKNQPSKSTSNIIVFAVDGDITPYDINDIIVVCLINSSTPLLI